MAWAVLIHHALKGARVPTVSLRDLCAWHTTPPRGRDALCSFGPHSGLSTETSARAQISRGASRLLPLLTSQLYVPDLPGTSRTGLSVRNHHSPERCCRSLRAAPSA